MSSHASRFVTTCQQLLALGLVCAVLTPAANVVSLELVPPTPRAEAPGAGPTSSTPATLVPVELAAYARAAELPAEVPDQVVDPVVREYSLTAPPGARIAPGALKARSKVTAGKATVVSTPQKVTGYGAVGVTWQHGQIVPDDEIAIRVRTRDDGVWSGWTDMEYHDDHGPDPDSVEGERARPGTEGVLVGNVDDVQVKIKAQGSAPADLKLAVIDPGAPTASKLEKPAIDTGAGDTEEDRQISSSEGDLQLSATTVTPKPKIFSRAQWGADERLRDKGSLTYHEVHAGFVHHTVNANDYKARDVPAILRGIYAYHTKSRGWADIGYNFLVDRFGRIWEGRYGGVDRPVVGAHTFGYNDFSFAMSAIGNFDIAQPSKAMLQAYGALFAWKLSLHGINAASTKQWVGTKNFPAINGHRDAASTACPGRYLYAKLPEIRAAAKAAQASFAGRKLESNLALTPHPDLVVRRGADARGFVIPLKKTADGQYKAAKPIDTGVSFPGANRIMNAGDWDRDGFVDVVSRVAGTLYLYRGRGDGTLEAAVPIATGFGKVGMLAVVGDMTGDGYPDIMGQPQGSGMRVYPGNGVAGLGPSFVATSRVAATRQFGVGLWDSDGAPDTLVRNGKQIAMLRGNGPGGITGKAKILKFDASPFDWVVGISDIDLTRHADLVVRSKSGGVLYLIQSTANGFSAPIKLGSGFKAYNLAG